MSMKIIYSMCECGKSSILLCASLLNVRGIFHIKSGHFPPNEMHFKLCIPDCTLLFI